MTKPSMPSSPPNPAHGRRPPESGWAIPEPGDVLSYAYLWSHEAETGREEGLKDRPVVVVIARIETRGRTEVIVVPVTHTPPERADDAVEMPADVKRDLGLDRDRSWIVLTEVNRFNWPGPDIRVVHTGPGGSGGDPYYGAVPAGLFVRMRDAVGSKVKAGRLRVTKRSE